MTQDTPKWEETELFQNTVRDLASVVPKSKSEIRRKLHHLLSERTEEIKKMVEEQRSYQAFDGGDLAPVIDKFKLLQAINNLHKDE